MTCANCGVDLTNMLFVHAYETRNAFWTVTAPYWYKPTPDHRGMVEGYCSPECSLARYGRATSRA